MKVGIGPWTFASVILLVAIAFIVAQSRLFLFLHRIGNEKYTAEEYTGSPSRVAAYLVILFALSALSFPATTFSLLASFAVPWQLLWPAAVLFLASGIVGLLVGAWFLARPDHRTVSVTIAAILVGFRLPCTFRSLCALQVSAD